jgi:hypothetical protein
VAGLLFEQFQDGELDVAPAVVAAAGAAKPERFVSIRMHVSFLREVATQVYSIYRNLS